MDTAKVSALVIGTAALAHSPLPGAPNLSRACGHVLREIETIDQYEDHQRILVPVERPLLVLVDDRPVVTLWTLGAAAEWLTLGYLWNQRWVRDVTALESIVVDWDAGTASVTTRAAARPAGKSFARELSAVTVRMGTDPGGVITGAGAAPLPALVPARVARTTLLSLLEGIPARNAINRAAGSVHGCALFRGAELWLAVDDVGRRNAIDAVLGWMALHGIGGADKILFTSGRLTAEILLTVARNGIPILVSRKGITGACYDLAQRLGMTLLGHAREGSYICYAGAEHLDSTA